MSTDVLIREFVPFFEYLASDNMFHVRKAFAMCCKELSPAMSVEENELYIVSDAGVGGAGVDGGGVSGGGVSGGGVGGVGVGGAGVSGAGEWCWCGWCWYE